MSNKSTDSISFAHKAHTVHNHKYDYSLVKYVNTTTPITIVCPQHGSFQQKPTIHLRGCGCPACARNTLKTRGVENRTKHEEIIARFTSVHGDTYDYSLVNFIRHGVDVVIICKTHGCFTQKPIVHTRGYGCPKCGRASAGSKRAVTKEVFLQRSHEVHGDKYVYTDVDYTNRTTKVSVLCRKHGSFLTTPDNHMQGYGCPKCGHRVSEGEKQWLDYLGVPDTPQHRQVTLWINNTKFVVDGFNPDTNTVYEYNGDYWHGNTDRFNPETLNTRTKCTFRELRVRTQKKAEMITHNGYNLVSIWDSEWKEQASVLLENDPQ